jgi:hypothetical protein
MGVAQTDTLNACGSKEKLILYGITFIWLPKTSNYIDVFTWWVLLHGYEECIYTWTIIGRQILSTSMLSTRTTNTLYTQLGAVRVAKLCRLLIHSTSWIKCRLQPHHCIESKLVVCGSGFFWYVPQYWNQRHNIIMVRGPILIHIAAHSPPK